MPRLTTETIPDDDDAWNPPPWLMAMTDPRHAARVAATGSRSQVTPMFRCTLSPTPTAVQQRIREQMIPRRSKQTIRLSIYQKRVKESAKKVELCQQALEELEERRNQSLQDIRNVRSEEAEKEVREMEQKMETVLEEKLAKHRRAWEEALEAEHVEKRQKLKEDHDKRRDLKKAERDAAPLPIKEPEPEELESYKLKQELKVDQSEIEKMNEKRTEMIWLLKQVIKAEEKEKSRIQGDRKQEPKIHASKQA